MGITISGLYLKDAIAELENGDVESATAKVEDDDLFVFLGLEAISESGGRRLIDNSFDLKASDFTGVLGGLTLRIVEVGRDGNNSLGNFFAKEGLSISFDFSEDHGGNFLRGLDLAV